MIREIEQNDVLAGCYETLGFSGNVSQPLTDDFLAALLRRSAGINCPCSRATLRASLAECLQALDDDQSTLPDRIDGAIEGLIVAGDLLELSDVSTDDSGAKSTWVFAAPPSFVLRPGGSAYLLGVVPDQDAFLPESLTKRIVCRGFTRLLEPEADEDIRGALFGLGLQQLSTEVWLRSPKAQEPDELLTPMEHRLRAQGPSGTISDLEVIDHIAPVHYYRGRWSTPGSLSGVYVGRRPQMYGAPLWSLVALVEGEPHHLLDLPLPRSRWRGCDEAWRLQIAYDYRNGNPQRFRTSKVDSEVRIDFFSPIPQWAERRLMVFGRPCQPEKCLFSYLLPGAEAKEEETFLRNIVWLEPAGYLE